MHPDLWREVRIELEDFHFQELNRANNGDPQAASFT